MNFLAMENNNITPSIFTKIILIEDDAMFQLGLTKSLENSEYQIVAVTHKKQKIAQIIEQTTPEMAIIDICLKNKNDGLEVLQDIRLKFPEIKCLVLTANHQIKNALQCFQYGANGYLIKSTNINQLQLALKTIEKNALYLDPLLVNGFQSFCGYALTSKQIEQLPFSFELDLILSQKEQTILALIGQGLSNEEISQKINISVNTVKSIITRILHKLHLKNRTLAAIRAYQFGLVA